MKSYHILNRGQNLLSSKMLQYFPYRGGGEGQEIKET